MAAQTNPQVEAFVAALRAAHMAQLGKLARRTIKTKAGHAPAGGAAAAQAAIDRMNAKLTTLRSSTP